MSAFRVRTVLKSTLLASAALVVACSGGGGGTVPTDPVTVAPPSPPPPPPPPSPPPPPPPPVTSGKFSTAQTTSRFLTQATFGPSAQRVDALVGTDVSDWLLAEFNKPVSFVVPEMQAFIARHDEEGDHNELIGNVTTHSFWRNAISGDDQLRLRMSYALSQILVVSTFGGELLSDIPQPVAYYQDILQTHAFGNYRDLLEAVTYSPAMGHYLTYMGNQKGDPMTGRMPDENYAREILQLFTIGLVQLNPDGTPVLGANGQPVEIYTNADVTGLARVFTGLDLADADRSSDADDDDPPDSFLLPMQIVPENHSDRAKTFLGTTIPAGTPGAESIDAALDHIMAHPNVGPFVGRQLIQRFTSSNPDPDYVRRVAETFDRGTYQLPNGTLIGDGRKGDLRATLSAVLLDPDNQLDGALASSGFGKVREPVLRFTHWARLFEIDAQTPEYVNEIYDTTDPSTLSQHPYRSKSVFNFYRPGYVAPGTQSGALGMTVPELQIVNASSTPGFINFMSFMIFRASEDIEIEEIRQTFTEARFPFDEARARASFIPDYASEMALADDPAALVAVLDSEMAYGTLSEETKAGLITAVSAIQMDDADDLEGRLLRVQYAVLMILTSPDYLIQR